MRRSFLYLALGALAVGPALPGTVRAQDSGRSETLIVQAGERARAAADLVPLLLGSGSWLQPLGPASLTSSSAPGSSAILVQNGDGNAITLTQIGQGNRAVLTQEGDLNRIDALQRGDGNLVHVLLEGSRNELDVLQDGDDNVYRLDFLGDDLSHSVVQRGDGIRAVQVGVGTLPFGIQQRGSGMELVIRHGPGGMR